jgi:hypothetical protein
MEMSQTVIFLHIPKNAGTSLRRIVERFYRKEDMYFIYTGDHGYSDKNAFLSLSNQEKKKIRIIYGHVSFGLHESLPQSFEYMTMLRDPVDRMISLFMHLSKDSRLPYYGRIHQEGMRLKDFVESGVVVATDNHQTRVLSGIHAEFGKCTPAMLEAAKSNLEKYFSAVGISEYFRESILLLKETLAWKKPLYRSFAERFFSKEDPLYERTNVSKNRLERRDLAPDDIEAIHRFNRLDFELYRFGSEIFFKQLAFRGIHVERGAGISPLDREGFHSGK